MSRIPLSKGGLTAATLAVYFLFLIVVGYGWWALIVRWNSHPFYLFLQISVVGLILALGSVAIRAVAFRRAQEVPDGETASRFRGFGYWLLAALLTAVGTVSGAFNWLESRAILRDDIAMVQSRFDVLAREANSTLASNNFAQERLQLTRDLRELQDEIIEVTQTRCGFGRDAAAALAKINLIVPVARTSASVPINPCDLERARQMFAPYPARAWAAFEAKWRGANSAERRKDDTLLQIRRDDHAQRTVLDRVAVQAEGFGSTDSIDKAPLINAVSTFNRDLQAFAEFRPDAISRIMPIQRLQSSDTESYAATFQLMLERWNNFRTLIYLLLAIAIDFTLIKLLSEIIRRYARRRSRKANLSPEEQSLLIKFEQDPRFLWEPQSGL